MKSRTSRPSETESLSDRFQNNGLFAHSIAFLFLLVLYSCGANEDATPDQSTKGDVAEASVVLATTEISSHEPSSAQPGKRSDLCAKCHEDHHEYWREGGHRLISCTRCHGFVKEHTLDEIDPRPGMELHGDAELCLSCHKENEKNQRKKAPRIKGIEEHVALVSKKHSVRIDLEKTEGKCIFCHDPHSLE
jgi:hypothetical protein